MRSLKARLGLVLAMLAMLLAVSTPAVAQDDFEEEFLDEEQETTFVVTVEWDIDCDGVADWQDWDADNDNVDDFIDELIDDGDGIDCQIVPDDVDVDEIDGDEEDGDEEDGDEEWDEHEAWEGIF